LENKLFILLLLSYTIMTQNKATATLAVIVVVASLMVGATVAIALISEGIGIQKASAVIYIPLCPGKSPNAGGPYPCGGPR
jgi:hypothetical protein